MPNGYRRGGSYTRNGRAFHRRGASIKAPSMKVLGVGVAVGAAALFGTGSVLTITAAGLGLAALVGYRYRRPLKRALRPVTRRLQRRHTAADPHCTGLGVTVTTWGKQEKSDPRVTAQGRPVRRRSDFDDDPTVFNEDPYQLERY